MHQIWADKYTQETVIKKDHSLPLTMEIYSDSELIFLYRVNDIVFCWRNFVAELIFFNLLCGFHPYCWLFQPASEEITEKIIESRYIGIFLIIGKIIDIDIKLLNLSVISRNYRHDYRYRIWQEIYRKIIDIEKNDLSPTPTWNRQIK